VNPTDPQRIAALEQARVQLTTRLELLAEGLAVTTIKAAAEAAASTRELAKLAAIPETRVARDLIRRLVVLTLIATYKQLKGANLPADNTPAGRWLTQTTDRLAQELAALWKRGVACRFRLLDERAPGAWNN